MRCVTGLRWGPLAQQIAERDVGPVGIRRSRKRHHPCEHMADMAIPKHDRFNAFFKPAKRPHGANPMLDPLVVTGKLGPGRARLRPRAILVRNRTTWGRYDPDIDS